MRTGDWWGGGEIFHLFVRLGCARTRPSCRVLSLGRITVRLVGMGTSGGPTGIATHCSACRVVVGQSVDHMDTDGIHVHIRTFSLFVLIVPCCGSGVQNWAVCGDDLLCEPCLRMIDAGPEGLEDDYRDGRADSQGWDNAGALSADAMTEASRRSGKQREWVQAGDGDPSNSIRLFSTSMARFCSSILSADRINSGPLVFN